MISLTEAAARQSTGRRRLPAVAAVVIAAALLSWPVPVNSRVSRVSPELRALVDAVGTSRPWVPRLSGGFAFGPPPPLDRAGSHAVATPAVRLAAARLEMLAASSSSSEAQGAAATGLLATGAVDRAIAILSGLTGPVQAAWRSDLAAAYLVRFRRDGRPDDAVRALDAARTALRLDPQHAEAAFNLGLAAEACGLSALARGAWTLSAGLDPGSPWAAEARARLASLGGASGAPWRSTRQKLLEAGRLDPAVAALAARRFPESVRELIEDELLPEWGGAWIHGRLAADTHLTRARVLAEALARTGGDRMASMVVGDIDALGGERGGTRTRPRLEALARGLIAYGRGRAMFSRGEYVPARDDFARASRELARASSPLASTVDVHLATIALQLRETSRVILTLPPVASRMGTWRCHATEGRALFMIGLAHWYRFDAGPALAALRRSIEAYTRVGEREHAAAVANSLSGVLRALNDRAGSWDVVRLALVEAPSDRSPLRRYLAYFNASLFALDEDLLEAALAYQDAALAAVEADRPGPRAEGLLRRAFLLSRLGRLDEAAHDVRLGRDLVATLQDRDVAEHLATTADVVEARLEIGRAPARAAPRLAHAVRFFERADPVEVPPLRLAYARALRASGRAAAADRELEAGIATLEARRAGLDADLRTSYFGDGQELFVDLVAAQVSSGAPPSLALATAERSKARTLSERLAGLAPGAADTGVREGARATTILSWFVLPDRLVAWIARPGGIVQREVMVTRDRLSRAVSGQADDRSRQLSRWLIDPIADLLPGGGTLVISPHDALGGVAPALLSRASGRRLIDDYVLVTTPSVRAFEQASVRLARLSVGRPVRLLAVADPAFDRTVFPALPRLPGALAEVRAIAAMYRDARVFTNASATSGVVLAGLPRADVVHLSAHGQSNDAAPGLSHLVMAAARGDGGMLLAKDLTWREPIRARLVVLGACRSAAGPYESGEGILSLARPFLLAGVPSVVAALWDVDDAASRELLVRLHGGLMSGLSPAAALRAAQLELEASKDPRLSDPRSWAGFVAIGGATDVVGRGEE